MDLFQGVLLGLLALGLIVLVALLATLGGIRKALEQRASDPTSGGGTGAGSQALHTTALQDAAPTEAHPIDTTATGAQASTIRGVLEQHGLQETHQPAAVDQEPANQGSVADSAFAAHADDPQEEPFQRDGRWWFRRGGELLLYDEATGQWQPAPQEGGAAAPAGGATATQTQVATAQATPAAADAVASYWKCPTCGAVNGSTAGTCRMCFAARP